MLRQIDQVTFSGQDARCAPSQRTFDNHIVVGVGGDNLADAWHCHNSGDVADPVCCGLCPIRWDDNSTLASNTARVAIDPSSWTTSSLNDSRSASDLRSQSLLRAVVTARPRCPASSASSAQGGQ
jgi:hypothetical protein